MENFHKSGCGANDCCGCNLRRSFSNIAHRQNMGRILHFTLPQYQGPVMAKLQFTPILGCDSYSYLSHGLLTFWYVGMIPDLASIRDRATSKLKAIYGFFSFGWVGSSRDWLRFEKLSWIIGGLTAALVVSVHSIVAMDFATSVLPGWHTTIFPPYFVVGAILSGFAMVLTLMIIIRKVYKLNDYITDSHLNAICKILVFISLIMGTAYATEIFIAWYSNNEYEMFTFFHNRVTGDYNKAFWVMLISNALLPQLFLGLKK